MEEHRNRIYKRIDTYAHGTEPVYWGRKRNRGEARDAGRRWSWKCQIGGYRFPRDGGEPGDGCILIFSRGVVERTMSKLIGKLAGFFRSRTRVGVDKAGNKYFRSFENVDGVMKEKRWVIFKAEEDPTTIPVEWISWLNGQRKNAPTLEEMMELEARRERVRINVENLKKEGEERNSKLGKSQQATLGEAGRPNLKSFIQQFPGTSYDQERGTASEELADARDDTTDEIRKSEPTGSGQSFKPGTWQPPT